jgi:hypothetical protein
MFFKVKNRPRLGQAHEFVQVIHQLVYLEKGRNFRADDDGNSLKKETDRSTLW